MPDVSVSALVHCPRCRVAMEQQVAAPRPGAAWVRADVCPRCGSVWLDRDELEEVSPALGGLPRRTDEVAALASPSRSIGHCPRCTGIPVEVALLDVSIDFCPSCHGVWLDGGELGALMQAYAREESDEAALQEGDYRRSPRAVKAMRSGVVACTRCATESKTSETYITPDGLVCNGCYFATEEEKLARPRPSEAYSNEVGRWKWPEPRAAEARPSSTSGPTIDGLDILFTLLGPTYCSRCGGRVGLCGH